MMLFGVFRRILCSFFLSSPRRDSRASAERTACSVGFANSSSKQNVYIYLGGGHQPFPTWRILPSSPWVQFPMWVLSGPPSTAAPRRPAPVFQPLQRQPRIHALFLAPITDQPAAPCPCFAIFPALFEPRCLGDSAQLQARRTWCTWGCWPCSAPTR